MGNQLKSEPEGPKPGYSRPIGTAERKERTLTPRPLPGEVVLFKNSGRRYTVSFWYPDRTYEFEPLEGGKRYTFSENEVVEGMKTGKIEVVRRCFWW